MKLLIFIMSLLIFSTVSFAAPDSAKTGSVEEIKGKQRDLAATLQGNVGKYGRDFLEKSRIALQRAQQAAESGQTAAARRITELSDTLINRAKAATAEQETIEKTAIKKAELRKMEERIEELLKGKGK